MEEVKDKYECSHCGHAEEKKFEKDICPECGQTFWKCGSCSYLVIAAAPPEICPSCSQKCEFRNVTCYTPECGGPGNVDPRLV